MNELPGSESAIVARRREQILETARAAGHVSVEFLAEKLDVTPQTIRKDLKVLAERSLLSRVHGGAQVTSGVSNLAYDARRRMASEAKSGIGAAAAELVPDGASLFINVGTTTEAVAANLAGHRDLVVISNNLNVIDMLSGHPSAELVCVGGTLRTADRAVVGALAMRFIDHFRVDYAIIGVSALDSDGSLLDFDIDEVEVAQRIISNARKVILVADNTKVGRSAPVRICGMDEIDFLVCDTIEDARLRAACLQQDVKLIETGAIAEN